MNYKPKTYTTISNMLFCLKCTSEYIPSLLMWAVLSIAVKTAIPVLEIYIPKIVIIEITTAESWQKLVAALLTVTLLLALLGAFSKFCERCIYDRKNMIGLYYIRKIADWLTLQKERFYMTASTLRNITVLNFISSFQ